MRTIEVGGRARTDGVDASRRLADLYALHAPEAKRLAFLLTGDADFAEDVVQDAFVRLAGRFQHLRDPDAFRAYLRRTVVNLSRGHFRRAKLERRFLDRERSRAGGVARLPDVEEQDAMWAALQTLPERQRAALVLRYYEDLTEHQVADALGTSPQAAKALIHRGTQGLRNEMRGDVDG